MLTYILVVVFFGFLVRLILDATTDTRKRIIAISAVAVFFLFGMNNVHKSNVEYEKNYFVHCPDRERVPLGKVKYDKNEGGFVDEDAESFFSCKWEIRKDNKTIYRFEDLYSDDLEKRKEVENFLDYYGVS